MTNSHHPSCKPISTIAELPDHPLAPGSASNFFLIDDLFGLEALESFARDQVLDGDLWPGLQRRQPREDVLGAGGHVTERGLECPKRMNVLP